jgi:hypothetical protein
MRRIKRLALGVTLALATGAAVPSAGAGESEQQTLVEGVVVDQMGAPQAGATVVAYAWPSNDELAKMAPGTQVPQVSPRPEASAQAPCEPSALHHCAWR